VAVGFRPVWLLVKAASVQGPRVSVGPACLSRYLIHVELPAKLEEVRPGAAESREVQEVVSAKHPVVVRLIP
jgi:hypothetical protein